MSTVPGEDTWRDAGLVEHDEATNLVDEVETGDEARSDATRAPDEYHPGSARPDLDGQADEADVAEQAAAVPGDEDDYA
ncbi:hypothetical protein [Cellulosimicrobium marinum]|uniref:hypothetical protein n=1 Tax=Cellulosimicrobium marinum TaxID=1638992 RepID=UPI001E58EAE2|nr:hypothetical protein [Cellulosimicrobium marinum]MCB7136485.1 hypothetical protein [Cellulosimicrobium marinum]